MKIFLILALLLMACDSKSKLEDIQQGISKQVGELQKTIEGLKPVQKDLTQQASTEVEKLYIYEYKVAELAKTLSNTDLEKELTALGAERWDCFHVEAIDNNLKVFCKRKPKTYLNYVPRVF